MDVFNEDMLKFWDAINKHNVKYIMVGGVATNLNGYQRTTDDIDLWLEDTLENRRKFRFAFKEYSSIDYFMLDYMQIIPGWTSFNLTNGMKLDLLLNVKGLEDHTFDECLAQASKADIEGISVPFLHINHLIQSKKAANRHKDQIDVIYLEKIKQLLEEQNKS